MSWSPVSIARQFHYKIYFNKLLILHMFYFQAIVMSGPVEPAATPRPVAPEVLRRA